jgi:hypothetical protein
VAVLAPRPVLWLACMVTAHPLCAFAARLLRMLHRQDKLQVWRMIRTRWPSVGLVAVHLAVCTSLGREAWHSAGFCAVALAERLACVKYMSVRWMLMSVRWML